MKIDERWVGYDLEFGDRAPNLTRWCHRLAIPAIFFGIFVLSWGAFLALVWLYVIVGVPMLLKSRQRAAQRREHARLIRDCHTQHDALMLGGEQDALAFFGRFQPAGIDGKITWCAPPEAFPTVSRVAKLPA